MKKEEKGITLIALVVTIIILIILATVSIIIFFQTGIIDDAEKAKTKYTEEAEKENTILDNLENSIDNIISNKEDVGEEEEEDAGEWDTTKVLAVTSTDNKIVPVPIGYVASSIEGETSVDTGFVIKEGNNSNATSGVNEFVWVPVENINDIYDSKNKSGQLWEFTGTTSTKIPYPKMVNSDYREPDVVTDAEYGNGSNEGECYDAISGNLQMAGLTDEATVNTFKEQLQKEFKDMIASVRKYNGFYIGRYETGNLSQNKLVVQKDNIDISNTTWYAMYNKSKTIAANENVVSSMIWGCQWDATLRWMQTSSDEAVKMFPANSGGRGNYAPSKDVNGSKKKTASSTDYKVNNIYDMAGNVLEWTMEAYFKKSRTLRGGRYLDADGTQSANSREQDVPEYSTWSYGTRSSLYIVVE